jgi:phage tail sheath protein FI
MLSIITSIFSAATPDYWAAAGVFLALATMMVGLVNFSWPGDLVTESPAGSIPLDVVAFSTGKFVGSSLRGPINTPTLISSLRQYFLMFGPAVGTSYLYDAVRAWVAQVTAPLYVVRVAGAGALQATTTLIKAGSNASWTVTPNCTTFTLTYGGQTTGSQTTAGLTTAALQTALQALSNVGVGNMLVTGSTGGPFTITLAGTLAHTVGLALTSTPTGGAALCPVVIVNPGVADINVLQIQSLGPGADYNYTASPAHGVSITYVAGVLNVYDAGNLMEPYSNVTFGNAVQSQFIINQQSSLIQITWLNTTVNPDDQSAAVGLLNGSDGAAITSSTYIGTQASVGPGGTGIYCFADKVTNGIGDPGFILCPGIPAQAVGLALLDVAIRFRNLAFIDSTFGISVSGAITEKQQYADDQGHAIYCYGWVQTLDLATNAPKWIPRSPYRAAHIASAHFLPGSLANVGAGTSFVLRNAIALETNLDDITHGQLNLAGVDVARNFARENYGLVEWSARTISGNPLYRFLQVRVIMNVLADSLERGLKPYVFSTIDGKGQLSAKIKGSIDQLLWNFWNDGVLFGDRPESAFLSVIHTENVSLLDQGILPIDVFVKPTPIAERIPITLYRASLSLNFTTGQVTVGSIQPNN